MQKRLIGRKERADIPTFGLENIIAKIDSGAYSSSVHVHAMVVKDNLLTVQFDERLDSIREFDQWETKRVKSSNGEVQERYTIIGTIILGQKEYKTPFTLTNRSDMKYPVLLGRKLLNKNFMIDTSRTNLLSNIE